VWPVTQPAARSSANAFHIPISPVPPPVGYTIASGSDQPNCSASEPERLLALDAVRLAQVETSTAPLGGVGSARAPQSPM
jgi:hypothetical protein